MSPSSKRALSPIRKKLYHQGFSSSKRGQLPKICPQQLSRLLLLPIVGDASSFWSVGLLFLFLAVVLATSAVTMCLYPLLKTTATEKADHLPSPSSSMDLFLQMRKLVRPTTTRKRSADCPEFGCPLYPLGVETEEDLKHFQRQITDFFPNYTASSSKSPQSDCFVASPLEWPNTIASASSSTTTPAVAVVTRQSNQHAFNQDRAVVLHPFQTLQTPSSQRKEQLSFLAAIFDGHGVEGHVVANYVARELPRRLAQRLNSKPCCQYTDWIIQQLKETFVQVDQNAPSDAALRGGTTAAVTLLIGSQLYIANAGDSQTFYVCYNTTTEVPKAKNYLRPSPPHNDTTIAPPQIVYSSRRDKPHLPDELARIQALGGKVHIPSQHPMGSRVVVYSKAAHPPEHIGLAMSRSIGDWEWKPVGVTAEPIVDTVTVCNKDDEDNHHQASFLFVVSDGMLDLRPADFFARRLAQARRIDADDG